MKFIRIALIIIAVAIVAAFVAWKMAPDIIATTLSKQMDVPVKIEDISLSSDKVAVDELVISNPKGSTLPKAFSVDSISVQAPLKNYLQDAIVIDEIALNDIYLSLEFASPSPMPSNWSKILDSMKKSSPQEPKKEEKKGSSVLIKKLILTDINVDIVNGLLNNSVKKLDTIKRLEFDNISSESGVPLEAIMALILEQTLTAVMKEQGLGSILEKAISPKGLLEKVIPIPNPF